MSVKSHNLLLYRYIGGLFFFFCLKNGMIEGELVFARKNL